MDGDPVTPHTVISFILVRDILSLFLVFLVCNLDFIQCCTVLTTYDDTKDSFGNKVRYGWCL